MNGSIGLLTGTLGGGKTLCAVAEHIIPHILRGGFVYTNIALKLDAIAAYCLKRGIIFEPERVKIIEGKSLVGFEAEIGRGTHDMPVLVVFDEAALDGLNSRDWKDLNREFLNFNVLMRKLDIRMIYIAQKLQMLDKQVRDLCQTLTDCRNFKNFRIWGIIPFPIPVLVRVHHDMTWGKISKSHSDLVWNPSWAYGLYDSDALLGAAAVKFGSMTQHQHTDLKRIQKTPSPWAFPALVAFFAALFVSL